MRSAPISSTLRRSTAVRCGSADCTCGAPRRHSRSLRAGTACSPGWPRGWCGSSGIPSTTGDASILTVHSPRAGTVARHDRVPLVASGWPSPWMSSAQSRSSRRVWKVSGEAAATALADGTGWVRLPLTSNKSAKSAAAASVTMQAAGSEAVLRMVMSSRMPLPT